MDVTGRLYTSFPFGARRDLAGALAVSLRECFLSWPQIWQISFTKLAGNSHGFDVSHLQSSIFASVDSESFLWKKKTPSLRRITNVSAVIYYIAVYDICFYQTIVMEIWANVPTTDLFLGSKNIRAPIISTNLASSASTSCTQMVVWSRESTTF